MSKICLTALGITPASLGNSPFYKNRNHNYLSKTHEKYTESYYVRFRRIPFSLHLLPSYMSFQFRSDHMQRWYSCNPQVLQTQLDKWLGHISPSVGMLDQIPGKFKEKMRQLRNKDTKETCLRQHSSILKPCRKQNVYQCAFQQYSEWQQLLYDARYKKSPPVYVF